MKMLVVPNHNLATSAMGPHGGHRSNALRLELKKKQPEAVRCETTKLTKLLMYGDSVVSLDCVKGGVVPTDLLD